MKTVKYLFIAAALWFACGDGRSALGCGPYYPEVVFTHIMRPDFPLEDFAGGNLGVLQPTYARSYLYAAYRLLTGKPLTSEEAKGIIDLWSRRSGYLAKTPGEDPIQVWTRARWH